jgi:hypothetical protein
MDDAGIRSLPRVYFTHPYMMMYEDRLQSFKQWPHQVLPNKYNLARAGFIYTGEGDIVRCFGCGIRVSQWEKNDFPWTEHLKWSPDCVFLKMNGYGVQQTGDHTKESKILEPYETTQHDPEKLKSGTGFTGFNFRTRPDNTVQSNPQPCTQPFGRPQQLQSGATFTKGGGTLGGGVYMPDTTNQSN